MTTDRPDREAGTFRGYLDGPTAEELHVDLLDRLVRFGCHQEDGALGVVTPRAMTVLALYAAGTATVRYRTHGRIHHATGLVWHIEGNTVEVLSPDNRPGAQMHRIDVDDIVSVEVLVDDHLQRDGRE
jgi:hypothetical protein